MIWRSVLNMTQFWLSFKYCLPVFFLLFTFFTSARERGLHGVFDVLPVKKAHWVLVYFLTLPMIMLRRNKAINPCSQVSVFRWRRSWTRRLYEAPTGGIPFSIGTYGDDCTYTWIMPVFRWCDVRSVGQDRAHGSPLSYLAYSLTW